MGRRDCTPFVIMFTGRTGSSHLTRLLKSHPDVHASGEKLGKLRNQGADARAQLEWVDETLSRRGQFRAVGFKVKLRQPLDLEGFTALLRQHQPQIIRMERRNVVKHVISQMNVSRVRSATGKPNATGAQSRLPPIEIDPDDLINRIRLLEAYEAEVSDYVASLGMPTELVAYEELLVGEELVVNRVLDFLGVPRRTLTSPVRKSSPDDLRLAVKNFDEMAGALRGTPYETMLTEVQIPADNLDGSGAALRRA